MSFDFSKIQLFNEYTLPADCGDMQIKEYFLCGKKSAETNEDGIFLSKNFAAIVDGATAKSKFTLNGKSTGRLAMELVIKAISKLPEGICMSDAIANISAAIYSFYKENNLLADLKNKPNLRFTASAVIYSRALNEIWQIGDCRFLVGSTYSTNEKGIDEIMAKARAAFNETALINGEITLESLKDHDPGRDFIMPFLTRQALLQNCPYENQFSFAVFDGFTIDPKKVIVFPVGKAKEFVLSSDGYPQTFNTLEKSEQYLHAIMQKDPNCIREYNCTKGLKKGNRSFDDRAYLKIILP